MHILHVYEVSTALNNKETVLDQEYLTITMLQKNLKKVQFGNWQYFLNFHMHAMDLRSLRSKEIFT